MSLSLRRAGSVWGLPGVVLPQPLVLLAQRLPVLPPLVLLVPLVPPPWEPLVRQQP